MKWFQVTKTAQATNPFPAPGAPSGPSGPVAPPGKDPAWMQPKEPSKPLGQKEIGNFEGRDQHVRQILKQLGQLDEGRLATLSDALGQGESFWTNLSVSPAPQTNDTQQDMGLPPQGQFQAPKDPGMPVQTTPLDRPATTPEIKNLQRSFQERPAPAAPAADLARPETIQERLEKDRRQNPINPSRPITR